jgi:hypothetical protein
LVVRRAKAAAEVMLESSSRLRCSLEPLVDRLGLMADFSARTPFLFAQVLRRLEGSDAEVSTDSWECLAHEPVQDASAAERGLELHEAMRFVGDAAHDGSISSERVTAHSRK